MLRQELESLQRGMPPGEGGMMAMGGAPGAGAMNISDPFSQ